MIGLIFSAGLWLENHVLYRRYSIACIAVVMEIST